MRLQLTLLLFYLVGQLMAQDFARDSAASTLPNTKQVDANFLFSYYDQDGDHSAVTGGIGTEKLEDYASKLIINVPVDSATTLSFDIHINYYSSASTDRINENLSSASSEDIHGQVEMGYAKRNFEKKQSFGIIAGGSVESDYISGFLGGSWSKESKDGNRQFSLDTRAYFDTWQLIFPDELRDSAYLDVNTDKRRTFSLSFTYSQVVTKRMSAAVFTDLIFQNGLLSTPFHRVYFTDSTARIEKFPANKIKFPIGLRVNYFFGELLTTRFYYRFYYDNFGITASTLSLELPFRIKDIFSVAPFYRFYVQTASDYFRAYGKHEMDALFYTSDYDLSDFKDHKVGIGVGYYPLEGIRQIEQARKLRLSYAGLRYANYFRSDGLHAYMLSFHIAVKI